MPMPSSRTLTRTRLSTRRASTVIRRSVSLYLEALVSRLANTWARRAGSPRTHSPSAATSTTRTWRRWSIRGAAVSIARARIVASWVGTRSSVSLPPAIRDTSSRSSTRRIMWFTWRCITSCSCDHTPRIFSRLSAVLIGASGLRSSWPSMAMNSSLDRVARSARERACSSERACQSSSISERSRSARVSSSAFISAAAWRISVRAASSSPAVAASACCAEIAALSSGAIEHSSLASSSDTLPPRKTIANPVFVQPTTWRDCPVQGTCPRWKPFPLARIRNSRHSAPPGSVLRQPGAGISASASASCRNTSKSSAQSEAAIACACRARSVAPARPTTSSMACATSIGQAGNASTTAVQL